MAKQIDRMSIVVNHVRQGDGSYVTSVAGVQACCSDPDASNPTDKIQRCVEGVALPTYGGADTCAALVTSCFNNTKTAGGVA